MHGIVRNRTEAWIDVTLPALCQGPTLSSSQVPARVLSWRRPRPRFVPIASIAIHHPAEPYPYHHAQVEFDKIDRRRIRSGSASIRDTARYSAAQIIHQRYSDLQASRTPSGHPPPPIPPFITVPLPVPCKPALFGLAPPSLSPGRTTTHDTAVPGPPHPSSSDSCPSPINFCIQQPDVSWRHPSAAA